MTSLYSEFTVVVQNSIFHSLPTLCPRAGERGLKFQGTVRVGNPSEMRLIGCIAGIMMILQPMGQWAITGSLPGHSTGWHPSFSLAAGHGPHHLGSRCETVQPRLINPSAVVWAVTCHLTSLSFGSSSAKWEVG